MTFNAEIDASLATNFRPGNNNYSAAACIYPFSGVRIQQKFVTKLPLFTLLMQRFTLLPQMLQNYCRIHIPKEYSEVYCC